MNKPELLAPAGNMEKLEMVLRYGADAVYLGGKFFGLRAFSDNFDAEGLKQAFAFTHKLHKKAYVTVNIFPHNADLENLPQYLELLAAEGADGILVSDPGVFRIARATAPKLPVHISTQANNTNWQSVLFWQELGAERVVLARELSLVDIKEIKARTQIELEAFIHGAMCISYSGRCLLSNYLAGRDANRGACAQACRWKYALMEEKRPGQFFPLAEDSHGSYIFNSKDMCLIGHIPELVTSGLDSLKIEGRMKSVHYAATVTRTYREAIDSFCADPAAYTVKPQWVEELAKVSHRAYTTGFYFHKASADDQIYTTTSYMQTHEFVGLVRAFDEKSHLALVEQRNNMKVGEEIEILQPGGGLSSQIITAMYNEEHEPIAVAPHPQQLVYIPLTMPVMPYSMLRRRISST